MQCVLECFMQGQNREVINTCEVCLWHIEEANGEPVPLSRVL